MDVVVVGGGAAGCVVAARLSESGTRSVTLLEAGPRARRDPTGDPASLEIEVLLRPASRGSVRLRSADPAEPTRIELPGLREESDAARLAERYLRGLDVAGRQELRKICPDPPTPAADAADALETVRAEFFERIGASG